jgi:nondiscriminating glutamyl-tRNA synthetase
MIKTRIAPSPTGNLHLGTVRTALYNLLFSKSQGGNFYFRLEDTDRERSKEEFTQEIISGFKWLGINWDEAKGLEGNVEESIVRQSLRNPVHEKYIEKLLSERKAYKCYATKDELDLMRAAQKAAGQIEKYDNRGRNLSSEEILNFEKDGRDYVIRLNLGEDRDVVWEDAVRGRVSINTKDLGGDLVIQKSNGQVLYNFAVVIDDYEMQITHVFRGEDHISNTAKQIVIFEALGFDAPVFGHLPLIFTSDKQKLSKRKHGDIAGIQKYIDEGYLPKALSNYLISTSYTPMKASQEKNDKSNELYTLEEAAENFDIKGISKSPAIYDIKKLNWFNREYISRLSIEVFYNLVKPWLRYDLAKYSEQDQLLLLDSVRNNLDKLDEINYQLAYFFEDFSIEGDLIPYLESGANVLESFKEALLTDKFDFSDPSAMKNTINEIGDKLSLTGKKLFWPIRIFISGRSHGPDLGIVMYFLGKEKILNKF